MTSLKQERAKLVADARQIHDQAEKEARDLTAEENARFSAIMTDVEKYGERIAQADKLEAIEASLKESTGRISRPQEGALRAAQSSCCGIGSRNSSKTDA